MLLLGGGAAANAAPEPDQTNPNLSAISVLSDEGLELSQRMSESIFVGPGLDADSEEVIRGE